jgi:ketosteroid isomerase-like protein
MSDENVEIVRRSLEAYQTGDITASVVDVDPEVEFDMTFRPEGRIFRGLDGIAEGMRTWTGTFKDWSFEVEDLIDAGDQVLVIARESGRGKKSGIEIDQLVFQLFRLRRGKVIHWKLYLDRAEALEAAGLSE